ncbi:MAG: AAA family ATPase [Candidatus Promineifilaceae bacterium]|nr:AAA family ATPase [Candidatus Promineifilaceae bacterium]
MAHIIAFSNQKGGTAKTTTVANLAVALNEMGRRVLVVDIDPQASLTIGFGVDASRLPATLYDAIIHDTPLAEIIVPVREHVDLAPTNINLSVAELQLVGEMRREDRLRHALAAVEEEYDFVLIDCPPSLGLLTLNALAASDYVVIPMSCDYYALVGVRLLLDTLGRVQERLNPNLRILGVLPTRFDARTLHAREVVDEVRSKLNGSVRVFDTIIRETVRFKEAPIQGQTMTEYMSGHPAAQDIRDLTEEFLHAFEQA